MDEKEMIQNAIKAREKSYAPYSKFHVGAYLETASGKFYEGCNIENASYGATNCAERTAFFKAVSEGERNFVRIAIVGGGENSDLEVCPPCGICLQVMREFCNPESFEIILGTEDNPEKFLLKDLLPKGFGPDNLK
ncbi:MAG: cytidine deaminase [Lachnospiraceae bacterium]|nr:cytidine deaminase [Lachnospiraceae bacterium]